ncbi:Dyp-type peroxidase [Streptosporangium sp. NPDC004631]
MAADAAKHMEHGTVEGGLPGVTTIPQPSAVFAAFDVTISSLGALGGVLQTLGRRILGQPSGIEVSIGLGRSLLDRLPIECPRHLTTMPSFPGDLLDPALSHGDLLLQVCASTTNEAEAILRALTRQLGLLIPRWSIAGFRPGGHVESGRALTRNLFGFIEGHGNPAIGPATNDAVLTRHNGTEPGWAAGGTYQIVRLIRLAQQLWDADSVTTQERVIGRRHDGTWLDGTPAEEQPRFAADPTGATTPLDAHARRANPRTPGVEPPKLIRRSYSYLRGRDRYGRLDEGLIFVCYQADPVREFETVQRRLHGEALARYALTVGGGYFFVPPHHPARPWWSRPPFSG